jgi:iron complex outermembrane recepter protein
MKPNQKLSRTIAAILSASAAHAVLAADAGPTAADAAPTTAAATSTGSADTGSLQTVIVTAQRREENIQHVPITMEAMTGKTLQNLNVQTLSDFVKYLPNVTTGSAGPGQELIFMRGLSDGVVGAEGQGTVGTFPNVAMYLDDQSAEQPGRNLDIYAVDLERIEVLEGPQGTLFGAGAQAGVVRYITNKPNLDATEVNVNAGYGITAHGDPNSNANAVFNWPIIPGRLAARFVWFTDHRGGYINNLPATFSRSSQDVGLVYENGGVVPTNSATINNYQIAGNAINPLDYDGGRLEVKFKINDDWDVLVSQMYQDMNAQGVFYEMPYGSSGPNVGSAQAYIIPGTISPQNPGGVVAGPFAGNPLPPYSVNLFNPSYDKEHWENTEVHVDGKVGPLSLVYAGAYLDRNTDQVGDYTNYARGRYGYYYQCTGSSLGSYLSFSSKTGNANATCYSPQSAWRDTTHNTHLSQEVRLSTPADWRLRGEGGLFYEDYKLYGLTQWLYKSIPDCSPTGATYNCFLPLVPFASMPNEFGHSAFADDPAFFDDSERTFIQRAVYLSSSFDILPNRLTITGGVRYFRMSNSEVGGSEGSFYCEKYGVSSYYGPCLTSNVTDFTPNDPSIGPLANDPHLTYTPVNHTLETGMRGRGNLTWRITPEIMAYYTYSQGFRPGGFNRGVQKFLPDQNGNAQWNRPGSYLSDNLTNNEVGWKTRWLENRLQVDGSVYQENWTHTQVQVFCPQCGFGNLTFVTNGANYQVRGVELQVDALPMRGLSVHAAASWNSGKQTNAPQLLDNVPGTPNFGKPITEYYLGGEAIAVPNVFGAVGGPLANSPPFQANMRVRYDWVVGSYLPYVQVGFQHRAHSYSPTGEIETDVQPAWTTYDASLGIAKGSWIVSLVGTNLTNTNESLFTSRRQFILTETPMRPRVLELTFGYSWEQ